MASFVINGPKSELLGFGCDPKPIVVGGCEVKPKTKKKFLGLNILSDITWKEHLLSIQPFNLSNQLFVVPERQL